LPPNVAEILHRCKLFSEVQPRGFQRLVAMARLCQFPKGQLVFREREECPGVYVVGSGLVRVFKTGPGGKEHVLHMIGMTLWVRHLVGLMEDVVLRDAAGRLARFLLASPAAADGTVELPGLKRHVASHLDLSSETFSRTLRRLVDAGLIAPPHGNRVRIRDLQGLQHVAQGLLPDALS
jgi:CRP-like cAMP-binding protein